MKRIFDRLEELHMSQIELSQRTGIATSTIIDWRKKKINLQVDKLVAICKALDMSLVDLLCDEVITMRSLSPLPPEIDITSHWRAIYEFYKIMMQFKNIKSRKPFTGFAGFLKLFKPGLLLLN